MTLNFLTQADVDEAPSFTLDAVAAVMRFADDLPTAKAWIDMQKLLLDYAGRDAMARPGLLSLAKRLRETDISGLQQRADRAHGNGLAIGFYTRLSFELGSAENALKETRKITGQYGLPFDKDLSRSKHLAPAAALWAAHTHFLGDRTVPCKRAHFAEWLGVARAYQLELEAGGRELMRIPDQIRLPRYLIQQVGEQPKDKRMKSRRELQPSVGGTA